MALRNLSLVLILFAVVDATNLDHVSPAAAPTTDPAALCSSGKFPKLCQYLLATYHPKTADELRDAAIEDTIKKAGIAKGKADRMVREHAKDEALARRIHSCSTAFDDVVTTFTDVQGYLKNGDKDQADYYAYTAVSLLETCHDVFDYENEGIDFPTKRLYTHIKRLSFNTMSFFR